MRTNEDSIDRRVRQTVAEQPALDPHSAVVAIAIAVASRCDRCLGVAVRSALDAGLPSSQVQAVQAMAQDSIDVDAGDVHRVLSTHSCARTRAWIGV